ncbi:MAG: PcfJ domain-containing protein [Sneathiella sp.]
MPLIILFQSDPAELKALFGKGAWKKLASHTKSRNKLICLLASKNERHDKARLVERVRFLSAVESSVIQHFLKNREFDKKMISAARYSKTYSPAAIEERLKLYQETSSLLEYELQRCNPAWSNKRLLSEHDRAIKIQRLRRLLQSESKETIFCEPFRYHSRSNHYSAERLQSEKQIVKEAFDQHHCGAIYGDQAKAGSYAIFKITGEERGTLGVRISRNSLGRFECDIDQVKLVYNNPASEMTVKFCEEVAESFMNFINR